MVTEQDKQKAVEIAATARFQLRYGSDTTDMEMVEPKEMIDVDRLATAIETALADTREAQKERDAKTCDTRRAVFGAKSLVGDSYTRGLIDGTEGCATAIREDKNQNQDQG